MSVQWFLRVCASSQTSRSVSCPRVARAPRVAFLAVGEGHLVVTLPATALVARLPPCRPLRLAWAGGGLYQPELRIHTLPLHWFAPPRADRLPIGVAVCSAKHGTQSMARTMAPLAAPRAGGRAARDAVAPDSPRPRPSSVSCQPQQPPVSARPPMALRSSISQQHQPAGRRADRRQLRTRQHDQRRSMGGQPPPPTRRGGERGAAPSLARSLARSHEALEPSRQAPCRQPDLEQRWQHDGRRARRGRHQHPRGDPWPVLDPPRRGSLVLTTTARCGAPAWRRTTQ